MLDLPLGWRDSVAILGKIDYAAQFLQTTHEKHLIGGLVSRHPTFKFQYFLELPVLNSLIALENGQEIDDARRARDRELAPQVLRFFNIRYIAATTRVDRWARPRLRARCFSSRKKFITTTRGLSIASLSNQYPDKIVFGDETARLYFDDAWGRASFRQRDRLIAGRRAAMRSSGCRLSAKRRRLRFDCAARARGNK